MNPIDLSHLLKLNGWEEIERSENIVVFKHKTIVGLIIMPLIHDELPPSMLDAILKKADLKK
jgi:predicted RNA binding protein YcfA (HicA-like mRNA interferase family)